MVKVDLTGAGSFFDTAGPDFAAAAQAHRTLTDKSGAGAEFTGWLELPEKMRDGELKAVISAAQRIRSRSKTLVVIGIGGSYLGARGAIELLRPMPGPDDPRVYIRRQRPVRRRAERRPAASRRRRLRRERDLQIRHHSGARPGLQGIQRPSQG
jgi:hypothetical protein